MGKRRRILLGGKEGKIREGNSEKSSKGSFSRGRDRAGVGAFVLNIVEELLSLLSLLEKENKGGRKRRIGFVLYFLPLISPPSDLC